MPSFNQGGAARTPFGKNVYLRSTRDVKHDTRTFAASGHPGATVDGNTEKVLQPGTILANITSGDDVGKVGVFDTTATDGRQTAANVIGINDTFLPWQLLEHDEPVAVVYEATVVPANLLSFVAGVQQAATSGAKTALQAAAAQALGVKINFRS